MKVSVIGPTDPGKLSVLIGMPLDTIRHKAEQIGTIIAESGHELWINSDGGVLLIVAKAYQAHKGVRLVNLVPAKPDPWPIGHAERYAQELGAEVVRPLDWFRANYIVSGGGVDLCVCAGLSSGVLSELAYMKWDKQFETGQLRMLIAIKELLRKKEIPPEISMIIDEKIRYVETVDELPGALHI